MDPFAQRALLYNRPSRVRHLAPRVLSSLLVDDAMYVQRFATQDERGEAATLTLRMTLEERLAPNYKSATVFEQWVVHSVTGEPSDGAELPAQPHASCSPESVVNAQLDALKWDDAERCVRFASPRNVAKTVDADVFKEMLSTPAYAPLSDPEAHCTIARTVQLGVRFLRGGGDVPELEPRAGCQRVRVVELEGARPGSAEVLRVAAE